MTRFCRVAAVLFGLAAHAALALPLGDFEYVIVTTAELAPQFEVLAAARCEAGIATTVVTLDWIADNAETGVDLAETIRHFLQAAAVEWSVGYVLIGGDTDLVPARVVRSTYYPWNGYTDIATDLYYAGLDGDWDGDGDGIWAEPYHSSTNPGDDADLETDLAVGRAPVASAVEAAVFVAKAIAYGAPGGSSSPGQAVMMANVLFPSNWPDWPVQLDGATYAEQFADHLADAAAPWTTRRLYENTPPYPGAELLTRTSALAALDTPGPRLVCHVGVCTADTLEVAAEVLVGADLAGLTNGLDGFFFSAPYGLAATFDGPGMITAALRNPQGGCVGGLGGTRAMFPSTTTYYATAFLSQAAAPGVCVGDAYRTALDTVGASIDRNTVDRWTHFALALLADPTLTLVRPYLDLTAVGERPGSADVVVGLARPNPFNPATVIDYSLASPQHVELSVFDLGGRLIRRLVHDQRAAGDHRATWRGDDESGRPMPSGMYLARFAAGDVRRSQRLVLVR